MKSMWVVNWPAHVYIDEELYETNNGKVRAWRLKQQRQKCNYVTNVITSQKCEERKKHPASGEGNIGNKTFDTCLALLSARSSAFDLVGSLLPGSFRPSLLPVCSVPGFCPLGGLPLAALWASFNVRISGLNSRRQEGKSWPYIAGRGGVRAAGATAPWKIVNTVNSL